MSGRAIRFACSVPPKRSRSEPSAHCSCSNTRRPVGLLLVEALDPADPHVASYAFHLNPTRRRLVPSELLVALSETVGFARIETQQVQKARYALTARRP